MGRRYVEVRPFRDGVARCSCPPRTVPTAGRGRGSTPRADPSTSGVAAPAFAEDGQPSPARRRVAGGRRPLRKQEVPGRRPGRRQAYEPSRQHGFHAPHHFYASGDWRPGTVVSLARWQGTPIRGSRCGSPARFLPRAGARSAASGTDFCAASGVGAPEPEQPARREPSRAQHVPRKSHGCRRTTLPDPLHRRSGRDGVRRHPHQCRGRSRSSGRRPEFSRSASPRSRG